MHAPHVSRKARTSAWLLGAGILTITVARVFAADAEPAPTPSITPYGVLGLTQVTSAENVGAGRVNLGLRGTFYRQDLAYPNGPREGARIATASAAAAYGLNNYLDVFGALYIYNLNQTGGDRTGFGTSVLGAQGSIPFSNTLPLRVGAQVAALYGTGDNQINGNLLDGYNYLETRTHHDVMARLTQSLLLMKGVTGVRIHLNEGVISSFEPNKDVALLTGAGIEIVPTPPLVLGLEANSRTYLKDPGTGDPLWVTPSVSWRTPSMVSLSAGMDVSLSPDRSSATAPRSLEPWRIFAGLNYTFDTRADRKRRAREAATRDSLERLALTNQARMAEHKADSASRAAVAAEARQRAVADSLAAKAKADSLALARSLQEERAKRSDMEKQLLTTGLLVMDAVYFETGKMTISINSEPYLTLIAKMLTKYPKLRIEIGGHTDNVGGYAANKRLSEGRAAAVAQYMLRAAPELAGRLTSQGYAYSQPKASNKTADGRTLNRRTELKVLNPQALQEYR